MPRKSRQSPLLNSGGHCRERNAAFLALPREADLQDVEATERPLRSLALDQDAGLDEPVDLVFADPRRGGELGSRQPRRTGDRWLRHDGIVRPACRMPSVTERVTSLEEPQELQADVQGCSLKARRRRRVALAHRERCSTRCRCIG